MSGTATDVHGNRKSREARAVKKYLIEEARHELFPTEWLTVG